MTKYVPPCFLLILVLFMSCKSSDSVGKKSPNISSTLMAALSSHPHVKDVVKQKKLEKHFVFDFNVVQPLDHSRPSLGTFKQSVTLMVRNTENPVVISTHGYYKGPTRLTELAKIVNGAQVNVEHRYFGTSSHLTSNWEYLNVKQSAADLHRVNEVLRSIMPNSKYLATGVSKGGATAVYYKKHYPSDIDVVVNYVGPLMQSDADQRFPNFINSLGNQTCQQQMHEMMIDAFALKDTLADILKDRVEKGIISISKDVRMAVDYSILEAEVMLWQYMDGCNSIPQSKEELIKLVLSTAEYCTDQGREKFSPYYYQSFAELGNYAYDTTGISQYLEPLTTPDLKFFGPDNVQISYDQNFVGGVYDWLRNNGNQIIFVYGENDPWTAGQVPDEVIQNTNAIKCIVPKGNHSANIKSCSPEDQSKIESALESWLGREVKIPD